jgi:hypothetical protein
MQDNINHVSFWPSVEVGCVADVSEEYTETIFMVKVCKMQFRAEACCQPFTIHGVEP